MDGQVALLLVILVGTTVLFAFEWVSVDVVAIGLLVILVLSGTLTMEEAFAGFGSPTFILLLGLFILTAALTRTGVVDIVGRRILRYTGDTPNQMLLVIMLAVAGMSAVISNTAAAAFFLPVVLGLARRAKMSPRRLLLPLAFASIITSSVTLISTTSNVVVSGLMTQYGLKRMGMFELSPVGIPITIVGLAYMYFIGQRLIPTRESHLIDLEKLGSTSYTTEVVVMPESRLAGQTLEEAGLGRDLDLRIIRIVRNKTRYIEPKASTRLEKDDVLLMEGTRDELLKIKDIVGIELKADAKFAIPEIEAAAQNGESIPPRESNLVELLILPGSALIGRTLRGTHFREQYGVHVLAINRHGETLRRKISQTTLKLGDVLLVEGQTEVLAGLDFAHTFRMIGTVKNERPNWRRAPIAISIFVGTLGIATTGLIELPVAILIGTLLVFLTRCLTPEEAYSEVHWNALILIGSMLALGVAMDKSGTATYLSDLIVQWVGHSDPFWLLTGFFVLTVLLTQPMSNQAAAVVVLPIALQTATQLGLNPRTFAMTIALAASCSYLTPLEPACLIVYGPGEYRFSDFLKVGALLTLLIYGLTILLAPLVWPLT
ncbi:MAG TPA: SLC13 family permease [Aggregatilineaceae bacterium]|nr:SLC13 family permease [Aggregatilineaceae bacterium]